MNTKSASTISRILAIIAIIIALYNTYIGWFENNSSLYLSILILILVLPSVLFGEYSKRKIVT